jgi:hypothetical protein
MIKRPTISQSDDPPEPGEQAGSPVEALFRLAHEQGFKHHHHQGRWQVADDYYYLE